MERCPTVENYDRHCHRWAMEIHNFSAVELGKIFSGEEGEFV
jgi:hypothetical protein